MAAVVIEIGVVLIEAGAALLRVLAANAVPIAGGTATAIAAHQMTKDEAPPAANTTTVVGKGEMNCGDDGKYEDMLKKSGDGKLDRDHVPSKAALKKAVQNILDKTPSLAEKMTPERMAALFGKGSNPGAIAGKGETIAIPKKVHQEHSDTYAGRNKPEKIQKDSENLQEAAEKDTKKIEDAEGKEMDDECLKKYKKAAEKIRKKTHAEYVKELTDLIKDVIKKY